MGVQSECSQDNYKLFYECTARNLGGAATDLSRSTRRFVEMLTLAGASAALAPASLGLSAFGTKLALGVAGYLLWSEVWPALRHYRRMAQDFLHANWIFTQDVFSNLTTRFMGGVKTSLNLIPRFRSLRLTDVNLDPALEFFISSYNTLAQYWNKLPSAMGTMPLFADTQEETVLEAHELEVTHISNPNVVLENNNGTALQFKTLSGQTEEFYYNIKAEKEGFVREKTGIEAVVEDVEYEYSIFFIDESATFQFLYPGEYTDPISVRLVRRISGGGGSWDEVPGAVIRFRAYQDGTVFIDQEQVTNSEGVATLGSFTSQKSGGVTVRIQHIAEGETAGQYTASIYFYSN